MTEPSLETLAAAVESLQARVTELEAQRRQVRRALAAVAVTVAIGATGWGISYAATGNCPNGMQYCFVPGAPAYANDINYNFSSLKDWIEAKVGPVNTGNVTHNGTTTNIGATTLIGSTLATGTVAATNEVRIQTGATSNAAAANGKPLFVTGNIGPASGIEFRHDNLTQGIGFGYNTIYATGNNTDQPLTVAARGSSWVTVQPGLYVPGDATIAGNAWSSGPTQQAWAGNRGGMVPSQSARCPNGQFVCGFLFNTSYNLNWWQEQYTVECCGI